jgi:hypothetical protein
MGVFEGKKLRHIVSQDGVRVDSNGVKGILEVLTTSNTPTWPIEDNMSCFMR